MNKKMAIVCLDIHGVCADFIGGLITYTESRVTKETWPKGEYDPTKVINFNWEELDVPFWANLKPTPELPFLKRLLKDHIVFIMTRMGNPSQIIGTLTWYLCHLNPLPYMPVSTHKGEIIKGSDVILIDDSEEETTHWPGKSILVPRPWNNAIGDPMETIEKGFAKCIS